MQTEILSLPLGLLEASDRGRQSALHMLRAETDDAISETDTDLENELLTGYRTISGVESDDDGLDESQVSHYTI